ncbi:hypothetical protein D3C74_451880 [compost metagenome]
MTDGCQKGALGAIGIICHVLGFLQLLQPLLAPANLLALKNDPGQRKRQQHRRTGKTEENLATMA